MLKITGNLDQQIMNILWGQKEPLKPAQVQETLGGGLSYSTVKTILGRMYEKGFVNKRKVDNYYVYTPNISREKYAKNLKGLFQNILDSYGSLALSQFAQTVKSDPENIKLLKEYLEENE